MKHFAHYFTITCSLHPPPLFFHILLPLILSGFISYLLPLFSSLLLSSPLLSCPILNFSGEIMYGGHIINDFDRTLACTYMDFYMREELLDEMVLYPFLDPTAANNSEVSKLYLLWIVFCQWSVYHFVVHNT